MVAVTAFQLHLFQQTPETRDYGNELMKKMLVEGWLEFYFGTISIFLVMFLAIERWCAVKRPVQYRCNFHHNRVYAYIISVVVFRTLHHIIGVFLYITKNHSGIKNLYIVSLVVAFIIPLLITWITFIHLWLHSRNYPHQKTYNSRAKQKLVHMCAITALFLTLCWLPTEIYFFKVSMGFIKIDHLFLKLYDSIGISNSIVNPLIYYFTNLEYRKEINALLKVVVKPLYFLLNCLKSESYGVGESEKENGKWKNFIVGQFAINHSLQ